MGTYVESNLGRNETIVKEAERNTLALVGIWIKGILLFWLLFIPTIKAIFRTIEFLKVELAITNKRVVGRTGVFKTNSLDAPLNKIQTVKVDQSFFGKIFNYGQVTILTAADGYTVDYIKNADAFKGQVMAQVDEFEEERIRQQAEAMASAVAGAVKHD